MVVAGDFFSGEADVVLHAVKLADEEVFVVGYQIEQFFFALSGYGNDCTCFAWYCVSQAAAFDRGEACFVVRYRVFEETEEQFDGIGALQMDVAAGVPAFAALERDFQRDIALLGGNRFEVEGRGSVHTSGAADIEFAFGLGVEVQQGLALEPSSFEVESTVHACLLIDGNEHLQGRVYDALVCEDSQCRSHADTVVRTEGSAVGGYPLGVVLNVRLNGVGLEVEDFVSVLLGNHVHVSLQNDSRVVLHARTGGLANQHIADFIGKGF